jgi:hypothetical protein
LPCFSTKRKGDTSGAMFLYRAIKKYPFLLAL